MTGLFRYMDALDRIEEARRAVQGGLLDDEWFDAYLHGPAPLPSYGEPESGLLGPSSPRSPTPAIFGPTAFPPLARPGAAPALGLFAPMPERDPFNDWYRAEMQKVLREVYARLLGSSMGMGLGTVPVPPAPQPAGHPGKAPGAIQDFFERDLSPSVSRALPVDHADRLEDQPLVEQAADGSVTADTRIRDVASVPTEVWTSAQFDQCVARGGGRGSLSTPKGPIELCSYGENETVLGPGSIYNFTVTTGSVLARDAAGHVHSATAKPGHSATMTIDTATGEISVVEPGEDI